MAAAVPEEIPVPIPRMNNYDNIENEELKVAKLNKFLQNRGLHNNLRIFVYTWNTQDVNLSTDEIPNAPNVIIKNELNMKSLIMSCFPT